MTLFEKENELFERWIKESNLSEDKFAKDGVADEELFNKAKYKILFLAKETNDTGKSWDTRKYLRSGAFYQSTGKPISATFNNIHRWANLFLDDSFEYKEFKKTPKNKELRIKVFAQIGMMNLKKITGTHTTDTIELKQFIDNNIHFINEQITLYKPDIIICCGKGVYNGYKKAMGKTIDENKQNGKFRTSKYIGEGFETILIDFYHPQARGKAASIENHFNLLKSIKEQYNLY